jgi:hypothetical protein
MSRTNGEPRSYPGEAKRNPHVSHVRRDQLEAIQMYKILNSGGSAHGAQTSGENPGHSAPIIAL